MTAIDSIFARLENEARFPNTRPEMAAFAMIGLGLVAIAYAITTLRREVV